MSFIAFELDALNVVPDVAAACGLTAGDVAYGFLRMWVFCFRSKTDLVNDLQLAGFFSGGAPGPVLEAFGFLSREDATWRVKGAKRYLRVAEGRRKGGLASSGNLIPGGPKKENAKNKGTAEGAAEQEPSVSREVAEVGPRLNLGSTSGFHRAPSTEVKSNRRPSDPLAEDYLAIIKEPYRWSGAKDGVALASLLKEFPIEKVRERWRIGLRAPATTWASCRTVAQLAAKWNDLAQPKDAAPVSAEHRPSRLL